MSAPAVDVQRLSKKYLAEKNARLQVYLEHDLAQRARRQRNSEASQARVREQLAASGIDPALLKRQGIEMRAELEAYRQQVRPALISRTSRLHEDELRVRGLMDIQIPGLDIIVSEPLGVQTVPASQNSPTEIRISVSDTGDGDGWGLWETNPFKIVTFWFHVVPTQTAVWTLQALTQYQGFYIVRADDTAWTSKKASVQIRTQLSVVQHAWTYGNWQTFCQHGDDNIDETGFIDELSQLQLQVPLEAGDLAVVYVDAWLMPGARGDGSYAELNFADGAANYIKPLALLGWPGS